MTLIVGCLIRVPLLIALVFGRASVVDGWVVPSAGGGGGGGPKIAASSSVSALLMNEAAANTNGYQESLAELEVLSFWDQHPFTIVHRMVCAMVDPNATSLEYCVVEQQDEGDKLAIINDDAIGDTAPNDTVFSRFYQGRSCETSVSTSHVAAVEESRITAANPKTRSFRLDVCYVGSHFCGWQRQPANLVLPSVQQSIEEALERILQHTVTVRVSGRTDAGVHAVAQVARVRTVNKSVSATQLAVALEAATNGTWRCWKVTNVNDKFHPTFGTRSRSYVYLMDAATADMAIDHCSSISMSRSELVTRLNSLLEPLQNQTLDYLAVSYGKVKTETTLCTLFHARAVTVRPKNAAAAVTGDDDQEAMIDTTAICIQLTGDRFLRRMVRILVATAMALAVDPDFSPDSLLHVVQSRDRQQSCKAAPAAGLVFVGADAPNDNETA